MSFKYLSQPHFQFPTEMHSPPHEERSAELSLPSSHALHEPAPLEGLYRATGHSVHMWTGDEQLYKPIESFEYFPTSWGFEEKD